MKREVIYENRNGNTIRIINGNSFEYDWTELLNTGGFLLSDPPYAIPAKRFISGGKEKKDANDFYKGFQEELFIEKLNDLTRNGIPYGIFGAEYYSKLLPMSRGWIVWNKGKCPLTRFSDAELVYTNIDFCIKQFYSNKNRINIKEKRYHPTQKPLDLMIFLINLITQKRRCKKNLILDPFAGSGSTAIAGWRTGFDAILFEREESYFKIIRERIEKELQAPDIPGLTKEENPYKLDIKRLFED